MNSIAMILKRLKFLVLCGTLAVTCVATVYLYSQKEANRRNGFIRLLPPHLLLPGKTYDLRYNSFYIAGLTSKTIYLASFTSPFLLSELSYDLKQKLDMQINWSNEYKIHKSAYIIVDSPFVYLNDGFDRRRFETRLADDHKIILYNTPVFTASSNIGTQIWIDRCINGKGNNFLMKINRDGKTSKIDTSLLQKQGEGIFSTDGIFVKIPQSDKFYYIYYYRNEVLCIDSNLDLAFKTKTIDTISRAHISVAKVNSDNSLTLSSPPLLVNRMGFANEKYLFVNSKLAANNENRELLDRMQIIDVYYVKNGKYRFSFYLPQLARKKANDFKVYGNSLVAIYDHYITVYKLNFE